MAGMISRVMFFWQAGCEGMIGVWFQGAEIG